MAKKVFCEGDEIISARADDGHGGHSRYRPQLYQAMARQSDGVITWRMIERMGDRWKSRNSAVRQAKEIAQELDIPFHDDIRHGDPLDKANS